MNTRHLREQPPIVLVVDDDYAVRTLLGRVAESVGCAPVLAASGTEGYGYLAELGDSVALLLLDVSMAGLDGYAFREMQLDAPRVAGVPTIVITGHSLTADENAQLHPQAVLTKPLSVVTLRETIASYTSGVWPEDDRPGALDTVHPTSRCGGSRHVV